MNKSNVTGPGLEAEGNRQDENMSDLQTAKQRLTEAARLDEFAYQGVWEDVTAVLAALPDVSSKEPAAEGLGQDKKTGSGP